MGVASYLLLASPTQRHAPLPYAPQFMIQLLSLIKVVGESVIFIESILDGLPVTQYLPGLFCILA